MSNKKRLDELTSLRFLFILLIFFHHFGLNERWGVMAVTFFFVLSGFCMTIGYKEVVTKRGFSYRDFLIKRAIKFYPLHWICLFVYLVLLRFHIDNWGILGLNFTLFQSFIPIRDVYFSFNAK